MPKAKAVSDEFISNLVFYEMNPKAQKVSYNGATRKLKQIVTLTVFRDVATGISPFDISGDNLGEPQSIKLSLSPKTALKLAQTILRDLGD